MQASGAFTFRIVDAATREPLTDVALHDAPRSRWHGPRLEPLEECRRVAHGASPLTLPATGTSPYHTTALVIAAPGYATKRIEVDLAVGGDMEVALERGGGWSLSVTGVPPEAGIELRLFDVEDLERQFAPIVARTARPSERTPPLAPSSFELRLASLQRGPDRQPALDLVYASAVLSRPSSRRMAPVANGIVRFDRLSPGRWAALLVKQVEGDGYCFGLAMETISAGQTLSSELRWQERPPPQIFGIHGTITISPGWEKVASEAPWIARLHRDEIDASEGSDGTFSHGPESELVPTDDPLRFRFDFGRKARGHYQMLIPRVGAVLTLVADHERERAWTVPPPIEMELTLLAARGDRPVTDRRVVWAMASAGRELREVGVPIEPDLEDGRFRFVVPGGTFLIHASVFGDHFGGRTAFFEAKPESNRITLRLPRERDVEVEISLRDGPRALAETSNAKLRIERDGKPVTFPYSCPLNGTSITPRLPGPGRYRLFVSGVAGYDDPPPLDFEVDGRGIRKLDVPMRRRA